MTSLRKFKVNEELVGVVDDLSSRGTGVLKIEGYPFFVEGVLPGEEVKVKVTKVTPKHGYAEALEILKESSDRVELKDPVGQLIGTMSLQHLNYPAQLDYKTNSVQQVFKRIGKFEEANVKPTIGMENPWEYRNKAQVPVRLVNGELHTGFYKQGSHDLVPVENFHIQDPVIDETVVKVRDILRKYRIEPYNEQNGQGDIRHVVVKRGYYTHEIMIVLVANKDTLPHQEKIIEEIKKEVPELVSLVLNINKRNTNVILGRESHVLWGRSEYQDQILGLTFSISAQSFFQVNTLQAERLYEEALKVADISPDDIVMDAYCGIGSITLCLAKHAKHVYGMEVVKEAIDMAKENAKINHLHNVTFEAGRAEDVLPRWDQEGIQFDVAVVDPPRKGLATSFIDVLTKQQPKRIVYVSCNPATCARDCRLIADQGYTLESVQPVDLFPQTPHVECIVLMEKVAD